MLSRLEVHEILKQTTGINNIYFQPPENIKIKYPAIIYSLTDINKRFANDDVYNMYKYYQVIIIDNNPDSELIDKIASIKESKYIRSYVANNLNHTIFEIYF